LIIYIWCGREAANKGRCQNSPSETKGIVGLQKCEMADMNTEQNVFIPPVHLSSLSDFKDVANEAAVVVYSPEYYQGPFMDDHKRLRRLTLTAVGVEKKGLPLTFKYVLDDVRDIDRVASDILTDLERTSNVVQGSMESSRPLGELLATWP
jgi:hypothetical protein